uniref:Uncharacterized protein n=1 Tax=Salix viminalis TaxID=40686 RepID=A0A6N2LTA9_SALVM
MPFDPVLPPFTSTPQHSHDILSPTPHSYSPNSSPVPCTDPVSVNSIPARKSSRISHPPGYLQAYHCHIATSTSDPTSSSSASVYNAIVGGNSNRFSTILVIRIWITAVILELKLSSNYRLC